MLRHRSCSFVRYAAVLAATVFSLAACSDAAFQSEQPAYPTFSLVGAPERDVTFDLSVSGPGMQPIGPIEVGPEQRSTVLEVPAGRNREFHFAARDDVYSGRATTSIAGGSETTVTVPIVPGPVFVDMDGGDLEPGPQLVQIRDFEADIESDEVRELEASVFSVDVEYADDGTLWFLQFSESEEGGDKGETGESEPFFGGYATFESYGLLFSVQYSDTVFDPPISMAIDSQNQRIAIGELPGEDQSSLYIEDLSSFEVDPNSAFDFERFDVDYSVNYITGLSFDSEGVLFAVAQLSTLDEIVEPIGVAILRIDETNEQVDSQILPGDHEPRFYGETPNTPWGDVRVVGDSVYVVSAAARAGDPAVFEYDLDLNLVDEWGTITTADDPAPGEFWGPRRFAATRDPEELIVIDQKDGDQGGTGRLIRFEFGETDGWQVFGRDEYEFFLVDTVGEGDAGLTGNGADIPEL